MRPRDATLPTSAQRASLTPCPGPLKTGCVANCKHHFVSRSRQGKPLRCCPGRHPRWTPMDPRCAPPCPALPTTAMSYRLRSAAALVARCGRLASLASCVLSPWSVSACPALPRDSRLLTSPLSRGHVAVATAPAAEQHRHWHRQLNSQPHAILGSVLGTLLLPTAPAFPPSRFFRSRTPDPRLPLLRISPLWLIVTVLPPPKRFSDLTDPYTS